MKYIAIIGYGVVGGGITAVIEANREQIKRTVHDDVEVKYILDLRDFEGLSYSDKFIKDFSIIKNEPDVKIVRIRSIFFHLSNGEILTFLWNRVKL